MERLRTSSEDISWQHRAWLAYTQVGEIHFAFNLVANVISRIRFFPAAEVAQNAAPSYVDDSTDLTPGIAAGRARRRPPPGPQPGRHVPAGAPPRAVNLSIPGEAYLVQMPATTTSHPDGVVSTGERWEVRSTDEVVVSTDRKAPIRIRNRSDAALNEYTTLSEKAFIARIWRRHPRWSNQADSSLRAVLDLVDELLLLNQTFKSTARSRLNTGILFVPDGLSASTPAPAALPAPTSQPTPRSPPTRTSSRTP